MSLFRLLFGKRVPPKVEVKPEAIWLTTPAKIRGLQRELDHLADSDAVAILVVTQFQDAKEQAREVVADYAGTTPAIAVIASDLSPDVARDLDLDETSVIEMIVIQRHPLKHIDDQVVDDFAASLPCKVRVARHSALDEPLMKVFAGEFVMKMLKQMGMGEDEKIESKLVSKRIDQAQQKLTSGINTNHSATSMEEWFEKNGLNV